MLNIELGVQFFRNKKHLSSVILKAATEICVETTKKSESQVWSDSLSGSITTQVN